MPNAKFWILEDGKPIRFFYTSSNKEIPSTDRIRICKLLGITYESEDSSVTHEIINSLQLPENPTFTNDEGRKYWL